MKLIERKADKGEVSEVIAHDVTPLEVNTDARAYSKLGWIIVLAGVVGFLAWALWAPLDKGVPMSGTVAKEGNRKAIQSQSGGIIADILVKDGDVVKAGQVLVRMNNVQSKSQADITRTQYLTARAAEARLLAERDHKSSIAIPPELAAQKNDPRVQEVMAIQNQLFTSRKMALQNELAAMDENIAGLRMQIKGLEESRESKKEQQGMLKEQLSDLRDLSKEGYIARNRLLEVERTFSQINGAISEDIGNIGRTQRQVMELSLRKAQRLQEFQKEVGTQLADTQREAEGLGARLTAMEFDLANSEVRAPVDGVVVGQAVFTRGGVVGPGFKMMDVVPEDDPLVVEGQLPVNLVDKVRVGLPAELIFSAFNANKTPHIPGVVTSVSADRLVDEHSGQPYYRVRARVTKEGAKMASRLDIRPGMPVEMFVKTGERTMMSYLLKPVFDRAKTSMTEE
jgi:protease secretion system membrane fusion protein